MWTKRIAGVLVFVVAPLMMTGAGCKVNQAASDKCKDSENGEKCDACCKENGANGYTFVSGSGCTCRG